MTQREMHYFEVSFGYAGDRTVVRVVAVDSHAALAAALERVAVTLRDDEVIGLTPDELTAFAKSVWPWRRGPHYFDLSYGHSGDDHHPSLFLYPANEQEYRASILRGEGETES